MLDRSEVGKRGYLNEDYRLFHPKDTRALKLGYHYHEFDKLVFLLRGRTSYTIEGKRYLLRPMDVLLVSRKEAVDGGLTSVKLCVIIGGGDAAEVERRLYVDIDSDLPYDVLVYTREEWNRLAEDSASFASRIRKTGRVLYAADAAHQ